MARGNKGPTPPGPSVGRYKSAEQTGRYTAPVPRSIRRSSPWLGVSVLVLLLGGLLMILLNYLSVLPGSTSTWYLVAGLVVIFTGFVLATRYR
jgi:uncharacterized membrane protein